MGYVAGKSRRRWASWSVVGAIAAVPLAAAACSSLGGTTYSSSIVSITPISTAEARVAVNIKNTGSNSGTPGCSVNLSSPGHAYNGFATIHPATSIKPGEMITRTAVITVTNQGANQVTVSDSTVHCFPA